MSEHGTGSYFISGGIGGAGGAGGGNGGKGGVGGGPVLNIHTANNITMQGHGLIEDLRKWLDFPPETKDRQWELRSQRHEDTGQWLLSDSRFVRWKATPSLLWIKGISGTGKSVLSSIVIEDIINLQGPTIAYFYFDFRNARRHMDVMVRSIIWQLSGRSPSQYGTLHQLYKTLGNGTIQPQHAHLRGVLQDLLAELDETYIVIDGLDECEKMDWNHLVQFMHSLCEPTKNALHLLFTSQPLEEFHKAYNNGTFIELGSKGSIDDIRSFVSSEIPGIGNWASDNDHTTHVTEQIVQKSNGMIRMAACLLIELRNCFWEDSWEEVLSTLPADLFSIYGRFFTRAKVNLPTAFIQAIFRWLVFSARPLTPDELSDAIAFRLSDPDFDFSDPAKSIYDPKRRRGNSDSFKVLWGLIVIKNNNQGSAKPSIALAHSSVKDYLLSPQFQREFGGIINLTDNVSHQFLSQSCVRYLLLFAETNHSMTPETLPNYPVSLYAAKYWLSHLRLCDAPGHEVIFPSTMRLLEDGSSQYAALYHLYRGYPMWESPISPLSMCSKLRYPEGAHFVLNQSNSVNEATEHGTTALHLGSELGHPDVVKVLLEHNASVHQADEDGWTALHFAAHDGHLQVVQLLIEHSISIDKADKALCTALHHASQQGHHDVVQLLIQHNASVDRRTEHGKTALHLAFQHHQLNIVRLLIENNASGNIRDIDGWTALHLAADRNQLKIVQLLLEHNAVIDQGSFHGDTALHLAASNGHFRMVQLLIAYNASVNQATTDGSTALHYASEHGHFSVARVLIEHSSLVDQATADDTTALHCASENGHISVVQPLIEHDASVDQANECGWTALHLASKQGHHAIVQLLIQHNALVDRADKDSYTALHFAAEQGHLEVVRVLIEHNTLVNQATTEGWTALHFASEQGHLEIVQLLINHNASLDQACVNGKTAVQLASEQGYLNIVQLLGTQKDMEGL